MTSDGYITCSTGSAGNIGFSPLNYTWTISTTDGFRKESIKKYIINDGATIIFWSDNTKTVSKRHKDDVFDKELGFLFAYYYKKCGLSNASRKRVINSIDYSHIKTFLFEMFVKYSGKTPEQARKYLKNLKTDCKDTSIEHSIKVINESYKIAK